MNKEGKRLIKNYLIRKIEKGQYPYCSLDEINELLQKMHQEEISLISISRKEEKLKVEDNLMKATNQLSQFDFSNLTEEQEIIINKHLDNYPIRQLPIYEKLTEEQLFRAKASTIEIINLIIEGYQLSENTPITYETILSNTITKLDLLPKFYQEVSNNIANLSKEDENLQLTTYQTPYLPAANLNLATANFQELTKYLEKNITIDYKSKRTSIYDKPYFQTYDSTKNTKTLNLIKIFENI